MEDTLGALRELLQELLRSRLDPHGLQEVFEALAPWVRSPRAEQRQRSLGLSRALLEFFLRHLRVCALTPFYNLGWLLALLAPRCADGIPEIRRDSVDCVRSLLRIQLRYQGFSGDPRELQELEALKSGLDHPDPPALLLTCTRLGSVLGRRIPPEQLPGLLLALLDSWRDPEGNCAAAAAALAHALLRHGAALLRQQVPELLSALLSLLSSLPEGRLRLSALHSLLLLARPHPGALVGALLGGGAAPLPLDGPVRASWRALGSDAAVAAPVLEQLLERLEKGIPCGGGRARPPPDGLGALAATCALDELMSAPEAAAAILERFPRLFRSLLLLLGCSGGLRAPKGLQACSCVGQALRALLSRAGLDGVVGDVGSAGGWELAADPERHHQGVALLAGAMARLCGPRLPPLVRSLIPALGSVSECQRVTSTAFLAELLNHNVVNDLILLEPLLEALTALEKDSCLLVRVLALRGLGNAASGSPEKVRRHGSQLLASLLGALDDEDDGRNLLALEAMAGLSRLLGRLEERHARPALLHVAVRVRPFFDSEHPDLRRSSIVLLGNLSRFSRADSEVFSEQILNGLVTLLLHLQDPQPGVVKASKFALRMCGPSLGCEELREMFGNHLREERGLHYGEFLNDTCKFLMRSHPSLLARLVSTNLFYFKSPWWELRAAAAMFVGFLVLHMDEEQGQQLDLDQLISALKLLLKDPVPEVRIKAVETLGRLVRLL